MPIIISIILGPLAYFIFGWIASSIYFSINPVDGNDLITNIISTSVLIYAIIAAIYNFIMVILNDTTESDIEVNIVLIIVAIPIGSWFLCCKIFPISEGATLLNYILCLGSMVYCGYRGLQKAF